MSITFTPEQQLPEILHRYPHVRAVFDRYGLKGCGGAHGPAESIEFFARTHGVELGKLIAEMQTAAASPPAAAAPAKANFADAAYRPFFLAGMGVFVLLGIVVGTTMLAWMSSEQSFFAPGIHRINAHANAMVYGFAGMFILGFGYQALPRFRHTQLWRPQLALASFVMLLAGVLLRFGGEFFGQQGIYEPALATWGFAAAVAGNVLEFGAFVLFALILWKTLRTNGRFRVYERYVMAAGVWFVLSIPVCLVLFVMTHRAEHFGEMVSAVAVWQESLRTMQMFGGIGLVILGVMLRFLPAVFGFRDPGEKLYSALLWVLNAGIAISVVTFPLMMASQRGLIDPAWLSPARGLWAFAMLLVVGGFAAAVAAFAPWRKARRADRSIKFVRAAHVWLGITLLLMLFEPIYIAAIQGTFGHGYHAGLRHAYTIGFMTMMIVAVSIKVVPNLNGVNPAGLKGLWSVFVLLNLALVWRVAGEIAGDFNQALLAGIYGSGVMVGVALLIWAAHLARLMLAPPVYKPERATDITPDTKVAAVLDGWPQTMPVFVRNGFTLLQNPVARRTIARSVSLSHVCKMSDKDVAAFVRELRVAAGLDAPEEAPADLPVVDPDLSVADTARTHPETVAVFASLNMDACCGGADSIRNAAAHNGLELNDVLQQLAAAIREEQHETAGTVRT